MKKHIRGMVSTIVQKTCCNCNCTSMTVLTAVCRCMVCCSMMTWGGGGMDGRVQSLQVVAGKVVCSRHSLLEACTICQLHRLLHIITWAQYTTSSQSQSAPPSVNCHHYLSTACVDINNQCHARGLYFTGFQQSMVCTAINCGDHDKCRHKV